LLAGAAVVGLSTAAIAEEGIWYGTIAAGANWLDDVDGTATVPTTVLFTFIEHDHEFDQGWVVSASYGVTLGHYLGSSWRTELELSYRTNDIEASRTTSFLGTFPVPMSGEASSFSQMLNLIYDVPIGETFMLSLGGGVGGALANVEIAGTTAGFGLVTNTLSIDDDDYAFAWQAIAGLSVNLSDTMQIFAEYRFHNVQDISAVGSVSGTAFTAQLTGQDLQSQSGLLGLRMYFSEPEPAVVEAPPPGDAPPPPSTYIVFFDFNKSNLTAEAQSVVAEAAEAYKSKGSVRVQVVGHTDTVGSASYNQQLSERRAASVAAEMVRLGVPSDAITTEGRGFSDPMVPTGPGVREPQNRRAVIDLQ
jgi:outer membrane protein OmpA-like peptidoglycan-associated protein